MTDCILDSGLLAMFYCSLANVFTAPSLGNFLVLSAGWLLCRARRTTTALIRCADAIGQKHFGSYHRFFSQARWSLEEFWLVLVSAALKELHPADPLVLVGDDTVQGKSGRKISGAAHWRNACGSTRQQYRFLWELSLVILGLAVQFAGKTFCLPVSVRVCRKKKGSRSANRPSPSRSELMLEMVKFLVEGLHGRCFVLLADGQYATKKLMAHPPETVTLVTRLRRDAALYRPVERLPRPGKGRPRKKGKRLPCPEDIATDNRWPWQITPDGQQVKTLMALWYGALKDRAARVVIVKQSNPRKPYGYFLCTDPAWQAERILSTYRARWSIEMTIRDSKQLGGLGDAQCRTEPAVERQAAFSLAMMTIVAAWYMSKGHRTHKLPKLPWYRHKYGVTFADMLAHARRTCLQQLFFNDLAVSPDNAKIHDNLVNYLKAAA